jgi:adenine-specific DNA-methyltransferase
LGEAARAIKASPSAVVGTALAAWCDEEFKGLPSAGLPHSKKLAVAEPLKVFVGTLQKVSFLEASYWLSSAYAMLSNETERKRLAMFFTPASLTNGLLQDLTAQGVDFGSQTFLDPACGGAAFLAPIALRIRDALRKRGLNSLEILKHVEAHLYGTDLDETLCALSKHFLRMALHEEIRSSSYLPDFRVHRADSLADLQAMFGQIDVVVCNPPYRKMTADELQPLRAQYSEVIESQPNLYCLFISLCVRLLREGGYAALVTPTSFLSGQYFGALRRFLARNSAIEHIGMVSDRLGVFMDVEQETALTVLRRCTVAPEASLEAWADVSVVSGTGTYQSVGRCLLPSTGAVWPIPRAVTDVALLHAAANSRFRLPDYGYRVRIGAYVWNRDLRPKFASLRAAKAARALTAMPLVWSSDISVGGSVQVDGSPRPDGDPRFVDFGDKEHTSVVTRPSVVVQRVTSNDQPRRLVAAAMSASVLSDYGGFVGENHVVILEQISKTPRLSPTKLSQLLSAHFIERYFRCISGATNVSAFELNQLALPDPDVLTECMSRGLPMGEAVACAFGL